MLQKHTSRVVLKGINSNLGGAVLANILVSNFSGCVLQPAFHLVSFSLVVLDIQDLDSTCNY